MLPQLNKEDLSVWLQQVEADLDLREKVEHDVGFDLAMVQRREKVAGMQLKCKVCESKQVQLLSWNTKHVTLRCRHCKDSFTLVVE